MTNRMKPLLATYHANRNTLEKIVSERIKSSGEHERMCKQLEGLDFTRAWRSAEMELVPDQVAASRICHHVLRAGEILQSTVNHVEQSFAEKAQNELYPCHQRM